LKWFGGRPSIGGRPEARPPDPLNPALAPILLVSCATDAAIYFEPQINGIATNILIKLTMIKAEALCHFSVFI